MRFFQDEADLTKRFEAEMKRVLPDLPVDWPTLQTESAEDGLYKGMKVRFRVSRIAGGSRLVATEGAIRHYRNYGSVLMQVIGPTDRGPGLLLEVADKMGNMFVGWRKGGMLARTPSAGPVAEEKILSSVTVDVPYQSDFKTDRNGSLI